MAFRYTDIKAQVDGAKSTFEVDHKFAPASVMLAYNGQLYTAGQNIASTDPNAATPTVTLTFPPPTDVHSIMILYNAIGVNDDDPSGRLRAFTHPPGWILNEF